MYMNWEECKVDLIDHCINKDFPKVCFITFAKEIMFLLVPLCLLLNKKLCCRWQTARRICANAMT